jgi:peptide/nickel transport system permease protein
MNQYVARRLLVLVPVFFGITFLNFALTSLMPGDAVDAMLNPRQMLSLTPAQQHERRVSMGLDQPWPTRYVIWLNELVHGNLGYDLFTQQPVLGEVASLAAATIRLQLIAFIIAIVLGIVLGIYNALHPNSVFDHLSTLFSYVSISIPVFFIAMLVIYVFAIQLHWFPTSGMTGFQIGSSSLLDQVWHMVLPTFVLSVGGWAVLMRYCRTSMLEVLHQDFLTTALAKGLDWRTVILRHALRNALIPVVTIIGLSIPGLIAGSVLVETVFNWPGMGQAIVLAIGQRNFPLVMGITVLFSVAVLLSNLVADLAYAVVDPRIRYR